MSRFCGARFSFELGARTYVMGILNVTPDSFYDGGRWNEPEAALKHALEMQEQGADVIDVGAQSTRPGHIALSAERELEILKRHIDPLLSALRAPLSVDTFYPSAAEYCLARGAAIVNDVSGAFRGEMAAVVKKYGAGWILAHTGGGTPDRPVPYPKGVTADVLAFFDETLRRCEAFGMDGARLCLDMGVGFGKTQEDDLELLRNIRKLKRPDVALLTALSNKRMTAHASGADGPERVYATVAADTLAIAGGTDFIRVHEVREAVLAARLADRVCRGRSDG